MAKTKSAVLNSKRVEKEEPANTDDLKRLKEVFDNILADIRVSMEPESRAYLVRIEALRNARDFFESELSDAREIICYLKGRINDLEKALSASQLSVMRIRKVVEDERKYS